MPLRNLIRTLLLSFGLINILSSHAQSDTFIIKYPEFFKGLDSFKITSLDNLNSYYLSSYNPHELFYGIKKSHPEVSTAYIFRALDKWYVTFSGSNLLYEVSANYTKIQRLDKTIARGGNYGQFVFYHNNLYSMGGYGFWEKNANLRRYTWSNASEWEIVPANFKDGNFVCDKAFSLFQLKNSKDGYYSDSGLSIIIANATYKGRVSNTFLKSNDVYQLQFPNLNWERIGQTKAIFTRLNYLQNTNSELFAIKDSQIYALDFFNNSYQTLDLNFYIDKIHPYSYNIAHYLYLTKKGVYRFNFTTRQWIHTPIPASKWSNGSSKLYEPIHWWQRISETIWLIILLSVLLFTSTIFLIFLYRKNQLPLYSKNPEDNFWVKFFSSLETSEIEILQLIARNNNNIGVNDLNALLGLSNKSTNIQKLYRHKILKSINDKFELAIGKNIQLIVRNREENDARVFTYHIESNHLNDIQIGLLKFTNNN